MMYTLEQVKNYFAFTVATYTEEARHLTDMDPAFANRHHMNEQYCLNLYAMECLKPDCLSRPPYWDYLVSMVEEEHRAYENINDGDQDLMDYKKLIDFFYDKLRWVREQFSLLTDYEHEDLSDDEPVKYMSDDEDDTSLTDRLEKTWEEERAEQLQMGQTLPIILRGNPGNGATAHFTALRVKTIVTYH